MPIDVNQFFFANSLVNFAEGGSQTNVPYWLNQFLDASGGAYNANGGFGFLRNFAVREEPGNEWGVEGVEGVWDQDTTEFSDVQFDQVIIAPGNFIQQTAPDAAYAGDTVSPLSASIELIENTLDDQPATEIFIYEGWSDLAEFSEAFPPSTSTYDRYLDHNQDSYHDWYEDYVGSLSEAFPDADITLIPVAPVLTGMFAEGGPLSDLGIEDVFVDTAPHGTETTYFLASLVTYQTTIGEPVPADFDIPDSIHPAVAENFGEILDFIETQSDVFTDFQSTENELDEETGTEPEAETDPETGDETVPVSEAEPEPEATPETEDEPDAEEVSETETVNQDEPEAEEASETEAVTEDEPEAETEAETEDCYVDCGYGLPALSEEAEQYRAEYSEDEIDLKFSHGMISDELYQAILLEF